jgi:hypothetical protein
MSSYKLSVRAATDDPHHAITGTPTLHVRAQRCDFAGKFKTRNILGCTGRSWISA